MIKYVISKRADAKSAKWHSELCVCRQWFLGQRGSYVFKYPYNLADWVMDMDSEVSAVNYDKHAIAYCKHI